ncbi:ATP-dependent nuclease subunit B [Streptococcus loxodontisalivarius]|uniref:ATP-dependent helicase/deoxyribonuclease subunit B n=1 Tax=Streptococcus loxodontisalivarius TaxID=1349415 RepID=A0ABS2PVD3_9STRE|nr:ATP-dependent nuclease subunit B [Streptococcus loxodontisalivarius]MBM7643414.1 ATP-dependent helicase/nuclease subunit B [Streptococcus loxodontisalivarius]
MKLLYTDLSQDMTVILAKEAEKMAEQGKRIFYIAPNSLSFEKERKVLENLDRQASFEITITRFAQMARYFVLDKEIPKNSLDDTGLSMIFYKVLNSLSDSDLKLYGRLRQDNAFIKQLVDLYKELKTAKMTVLDIAAMDEPEKEADLITIFTAVEDYLRQSDFDSQSKISFFAQEIESGNLDAELSNLVLVIDGFTRFSAEEDYLLTLLSGKCQEVIIGTYVSQKAYTSNFSYGNVYQASLDFLRDLATRFQTKPSYVSLSDSTSTAFSELTELLEARHDFSQSDKQLSPSSKEKIQIWDLVNQKEEVTAVARQIRQLLADGVRYREILVLLGDVESYKLQVGKIFQKFDIPYYFGKAESMANHPLVNFIDALERVKRYNYRAEDLLNLFKTGLYGSVSQVNLDRFEHYVTYADIKGLKKFTTDFTASKNGKYQLDRLNQLRHDLVDPLQNFLKARSQKASGLLEKLLSFLADIRLAENMKKLSQNATEAELDQHEQVWAAFGHLLEEMQTIFGQDQLSLADFLALLKSGMFAANYRTVPATVDVVNVKSYDLVEPHSAKYVFAMGMTQSYFPKITENRSLISDQARSKINESSPDYASFDILSKENSKKNHFTALSVFNSASQGLVLSIPQLINEGQDQMSVYLQELIELGIPMIDKGRQALEADADNIGHYKDVLSQIIAINQADIDRQLTKEEQTFWSVALRYLRKRLETQSLSIPQILDDVKTVKVSPEVMAVKFPEEEPLKLSASGLKTFYNNQYLYFLQYVLGLQELETIHPDARHHGTYLHRIFEKTMAEQQSDDFDKRLELAIEETKQEDRFALLYEEDDESRLSRQILDDIARSTATVLKQNQAIQVQGQEENFELLLDQVALRGVIDRVDRLSDGSLGVVDYKSGKNTFDIQSFYNGLQPQLVTYLQALEDKYDLSTDQLFGAMYLHMQEPRVDLNKLASLDKVLPKVQSDLTYKGLFAASEKEHLAAGAYSIRDSLYEKAELDQLLSHNRHLFKQAAEQIKSGSFLINPYTKDGESVEGEQLKAITHFEADRHMGYARRLLTLPKKGKREAFLALMAEPQKVEEEEEDDQ